MKQLRWIGMSGRKLHVGTQKKHQVIYIPAEACTLTNPMLFTFRSRSSLLHAFRFLHADTRYDLQLPDSKFFCLMFCTRFTPVWHIVLHNAISPDEDKTPGKGAPVSAGNAVPRRARIGCGARPDLDGNGSAV